MKSANAAKKIPHLIARQLPPRRRMYKALTARDPAFEGIFFFGVRTTNIFCRATCRAKTPLFENVEFFASAEAARAAGFRPCLRCRPAEPNRRPPAALERLLLEMEKRPDGRLTEKELGALGTDPATARRQFKNHFGMSFHAYQRARRLGLALKDVQAGTTAETAQKRQGYQSSSAFRGAFAKLFGHAPEKIEATGSLLLQQHLPTPLGEILAVADDAGLRLLQFLDHPELEAQVEQCRLQLSATIVPGSNAHLETVQRELAEYFAGKGKHFTVPLAPMGTEFQRQVWNKLCDLRHGQAGSYAGLARELGRPGGARATGNALGANPIVIIIPCHRIMRGDGSMGGYSGGVWRKRWLLAHERRGE